MDTDVAAGCPVHKGRDDRKSATLAKEKLRPFRGARIARSFSFARDILRSPVMRQAGGSAADVVLDNPSHVSVFFLDGEIHRRRRASVAGYFAPKTIVARYHPIMHSTMDRMISDLRATGHGQLDEMSFQLAANVTLELVGLTDSDDLVSVGKRIRYILETTNVFDRAGFDRFFHQVLFGWVHKGLLAMRVMRLYNKDILPAVKARQAQPRDDVISYMTKEGYSKQNMIIEILTYAGAGVTTTREFMAMVAWHLFDDPALKEQFLNANEDGQFAILEEILRIDPVTTFVYRRSADGVPETSGGPIKQGELLAVNIRDVNTDPAVAGECPFQLDPGRAKRMKVMGSYMSFSDGPHRCPGSQVALHETRIFIDRLFRIPGLRLEKPPKLTWFDGTQGYELRDMIITCDPVKS